MSKRDRILNDIEFRLWTLLYSGKNVGMTWIQKGSSFVINNYDVFESRAMYQTFSCINYHEFTNLMILCGYIALETPVRGFSKEISQKSRTSIVFNVPLAEDIPYLKQNLECLLHRYHEVSVIAEDTLLEIDGLECLVERLVELTRTAFSNGVRKSSVDLQRVEDMISNLMNISSKDADNEGALREDSTTSEESENIEIMDSSSNKDDENTGPSMVSLKKYVGEKHKDTDFF